MSEPARVQVLYFAWLKQRSGCAAETIELPPGTVTVDRLLALLAERHPRFGEAVAARGVVHCAVNHEHVERDAPIRDGDEVAFFPPVTGG